MSDIDPEDQRLLLRAKVVAIGVCLSLMVVITLGVIFANPDPSLIIVIFPALSGVLLALFGIRAVVARNGVSK